MNRDKRWCKTTADGLPDGLLERLQGGHVICAGGYRVELERHGCPQHRGFAPRLILEQPELVGLPAVITLAIPSSGTDPRGLA